MYLEHIYFLTLFFGSKPESSRKFEHDVYSRLATAAEASCAKVRDHVLPNDRLQLQDGVLFGSNWDYKVVRGSEALAATLTGVLVAYSTFPSASELSRVIKIQLIFEYFDKDADGVWFTDDIIFFSHRLGRDMDETKEATVEDLTEFYLDAGPGCVDVDYEEVFPQKKMGLGILYYIKFF
ncbi:MAG: uncharacterized protein KVP18_004018 [Porospora cf. gigantea A]|uniref:uncharacterized protein n=1 Tax=Porospora cf. gigantea A TaxID=2853593 RepID=UPI003559AEF5|nr:MAG: hypothetical protein KVP18_004018 [Porospora cf. gigantea A]